MTYATDPTARADQIAGQMRAFYEANRPRGWWGFWHPYRADCADELMLGLLQVAQLALVDAAAQDRTPTRKDIP